MIIIAGPFQLENFDWAYMHSLLLSTNDDLSEA